MSRTPKRTQQGQTLPLVALCVVTLMVAAALSVDIGSLAVTNRRLQAVADLAAIDAARELTGTPCDEPTATAPTQYDGVKDMALASAQRNGFSPDGAERDLVVELGRLTRDPQGVPGFNQVANLCSVEVPDAVRVRAVDRTAFSFATVIGQSGRTTSRQSVGTRPGLLTSEGRGQFSVGSSLATVRTTDSVLLNAVLGDMLCTSTCNLGLSAVSYQGLVASQLTYGALAAQLGFGTTSALFDASLTADQILVAAATLVGPSTTVGASLLGIVTTSTVSGTIKLRDMVSAALATGNAAADVTFNVFDLLTGSAALANGTNLVSIPTVGLSTSIASITAKLSLIEVPVLVGDQVGATGSTKQLSMEITPTLNLSTATLAGLNLASVTGSLPITISGGAATGTLTAVRCGAGKGLDATVSVNAATVATGGTLNISLGTAANSGLLSSLITGILGTGTITTTLSVSGGVSTTTGTTNLTFDNPGDFGPGGMQPVGNVTVGLDDIAYTAGSLNLAVPRLSLLGIPLLSANVSIAVSSAALSGLVDPILAQVDTVVVQPLMELLGLRLGAADVVATSLTCGAPRLGG